MKTQPLSATNPYLKNVKQRAAQIREHVITSSAIEGVRISNLDLNKQVTEPSTRKTAKSYRLPA